MIILLGDINARVGSDHAALPECLGPHRVGKLNEKRAEAFGALHHKQPLHHKLLLPNQATTQGILEASEIAPLAPA